jgi:hypothetical protein
MVVLRVFDPPMCCSSGICGPTVNPALPRFAADLNWLKSQGVRVERYNLAQEPDAFASRPVVQQMLAEDGPECLPLILVDGQVVSRGVYPSREELTAFTEIAVQKSAKSGRASSSHAHPATQSRRSAASNRGEGCCGGNGCCG